MFRDRTNRVKLANQKMIREYVSEIGALATLHSAVTIERRYPNGIDDDPNMAISQVQAIWWGLKQSAAS